MKIYVLVMLALLAACSKRQDTDQEPPSNNAATPQPAAEGMAPAPEVAPDEGTAGTVSATGTVESVDVAAKTVTIAHGPVDALQWPAMTMTFKAPNTDLGAIKPGDKVTFEFTATGMDGTIVAIKPES